MIQIYSPSNTDFEMNGDITLSPLFCNLTQKLNGVWKLELKNVYDAGFPFIENNAVLKIDTNNQKNQLYRIYDVSPSDGETTSKTAFAYPIFLDCVDEAFLFDVRPTQKNGQQALDILCEGTKYSGESNIVKQSTAYYQNMNLMHALNGNIEQSFINRWGGEMMFDNYKIIINDHIGKDNHLRVEFGFNMLGIDENINFNETATRLVPIAYDGIMLPEKYIDSPNINKYPKIYTKTLEMNDLKLKDEMTFDDEGAFESLDELYAAMRMRCAEAFNGGMDLPAITYKIDMIDLSKTVEYQYFKDLTKISLGDTVHIKNKRLGIETDARVIELTYDVINEEITSITLGSYQPSFFDKTADITQAASEVINLKNNTLIGEKIQGYINAFMTTFRAQKDIAQKQDVRAILFEDLDETSPTYGAMCLGTLGFQISNKRTADGSDWNWSTAANASGIVADAITSGVIRALLIEGCKLRFGDEKYVLVEEVGVVSNDVWSPTGVRFSGNGETNFVQSGQFNVRNQDEYSHTRTEFKALTSGNITGAYFNNRTEDGSKYANYINLERYDDEQRNAIDVFNARQDGSSEANRMALVARDNQHSINFTNSMKDDTADANTMRLSSTSDQHMFQVLNYKIDTNQSYANLLEAVTNSYGNTMHFINYSKDLSGSANTFIAESNDTQNLMQLNNSCFKGTTKANWIYAWSKEGLNQISLYNYEVGSDNVANSIVLDTSGGISFNNNVQGRLKLDRAGNGNLGVNNSLEITSDNYNIYLNAGMGAHTPSGEGKVVINAPQGFWVNGVKIA